MSERPAPQANSPSAEGGVSRRLASLDALRGFDMLWIVGAEGFFYALDAIASQQAHPGSGTALMHGIIRQLDHADWAGIRFLDLIFPMFIFIVGVSLVFSLTAALERDGRKETVKRIVRRSAILFILGILHWGGVSNYWPDIRLMGVLQRIALCYLFSGLIFCFCGLRWMIRICAVLLGGYWAVMAWVPIRDIRLDYNNMAQLTQQTGIEDPRALFNSTTNRVRGKFEHGRNVAEHFDFKYLPGDKYDYYSDPEGYLSTFPAIATCLLGVFAGLLLRNGRVLDPNKVVFLIAAGLIAINAGLVWGLYFPIIKKIWTSSFVLVSGGFSAVFLGGFYLVIDVWKRQGWCQPFIWMGMNSITLYLLAGIIRFDSLAERLVGGDVKAFMDRHVFAGAGGLLVSVVAMGLAFWLVRFLYKKKIFLRV